MGQVRDRLLKLMQEINSVGGSMPLLYVNLNFVEKMEYDADENKSYRDTIREIDALTKRVLNDITDYGTILEIKNKYSEAYVCAALQSKLSVHKIPEKQHKTPDYLIKFGGEEIYAELKSLNMLDGHVKHREIMIDSMEAKIQAEEAAKARGGVGSGVAVINPYYVPTRANEYDPRSIRLVIESLIDKVNQNIKRGQYLHGKSVLIIDLSDQLPLISKPVDAIRQMYRADTTHGEVSGELWHVAFGKVDDPIYKHEEFEGAGSDDGKLRKEGILVSHPYIKALIFFIKDQFYSLAELTRDNLDVVDMIKYLSACHELKGIDFPPQSNKQL